MHNQRFWPIFFRKKGPLCPSTPRLRKTPDWVIKYSCQLSQVKYTYFAGNSVSYLQIHHQTKFVDFFNIFRKIFLSNMIFEYSVKRRNMFMLNRTHACNYTNRNVKYFSKNISFNICSNIQNQRYIYVDGQYRITSYTWACVSACTHVHCTQQRTLDMSLFTRCQINTAMSISGRVVLNINTQIVLLTEYLI